MAIIPLRQSNQPNPNVRDMLTGRIPSPRVLNQRPTIISLRSFGNEDSGTDRLSSAEIARHKEIIAKPTEMSTWQKVRTFVEEGLPAAASQIVSGAIRGEKAVVQSLLNTKAGGKVTDWLSTKVSGSPTRIESSINRELFSDGTPTISEYGKEILPKFAEKGPVPFAVGLGMAALDFTGSGGSKNAIKNLASTTDAVQASKILRNIGVADDLVKEYAPVIAKTSSQAEITKIIGHINDIQKSTRATSIVKQIDNLTKDEMIEAVDYIRLKKPFNQRIEENIGYLTEKYGISSKSLPTVADKLEELVDGTKTKDVSGRQVLDPLTQEARKYKGAEEFVDFNTPKVYRGQLSGEKGIPREGLSTTLDFNRANEYAKARGLGGEKQTYYLNLDAKKISLEDVPNEVRGLEEGSDFAGKAAIWARKQGYDILDMSKGNEAEMRILTENAFTTEAISKSQLTDIWNKANKKVVKQPVEALGMFAGVEEDEEGKLKFDPVKSAIGVGALGLRRVIKRTPKGQIVEIPPQVIKSQETLSGPKNLLGQLPSQVSRGASQATDQNLSQLAARNLSREVSGQQPIPIKDKAISYEDSITRTLVNKQEAKQAASQFELANPIDGTPVKPPKIPKNPGLVQGAENFKDISGFKGQARDVYRNFRAFFGDKFETVKKQILDPFDASKGKYVDEQKGLLDELKAKVVDGLGIKKGSKESAAVMDFGEKLITEDDLVKRFGQDKANKIIEADKWFRSKYDELLEQVNKVRAEIYPNRSDKLIPKRKDYYRHYRELSGLSGVKNIFDTPAGIDPALSGISPFTKPKSKFLSFAQKRLGFQSERDAVGGFLEYVPTFSYAKHIDPHIGKFRGLASDLAIQTQESRNANNFIEFLQDFSNDLSGKTNAADRFVQKVIPGGRKAFALVNWLNNRVKANTILGNVSSMVAQIFNVPQGVASAKLYSVPGALRTMGSIFAENKPMAKSAFIKERYSSSMFHAFDVKMLDKAKDFAVWTTSVMDEIGTKFIWNSHYQKAISKGMEDPVKYADDLTRALVAGRGIGEVPLIQKSKLFQFLAPFQLEVGNLWYVMGDQVKQKDFSGIVTLFVMNYLMNRVAEKVRGSDVVFDPINAVYEGVQALQQEEDKKKGAFRFGGRVIGEVVSNVPGGQTLASMYPEQGLGIIGGLSREELFGEGDPTRFGGGMLALRGLQDPLFKVLPGFGGTQIKKTIEGTASLIKGRETTEEGKVQFEVKPTAQNIIRSLLFGKYSTPEAQESMDELKEKEDPPEWQRIRPVYDEAQKLKAEGKVDEADELVNELSEADYEIYTKIKTSEVNKQKESIKPQILETYKKAQVLKAEGKVDEADALVEKMSDLEYEVYESLKSKYKDVKIEDLMTEGEEKADTSEKSFIRDVLIYAEAIGTDPITAFNRIITGQKIRRTDNGTIIVERIPLKESQSIKETRGSASSMRLDHTVPLQLGGSNAESNLKLVSEEEWKTYTPVENKLGRLLRDGKISKKEAQRLIKDFKAGKVSAEEILNR